MAKPDGAAIQAQDAGGQAFVERGVIARADGRDDLLLDLTWRDGHHLHEASRFWRTARQARQHGVGDAGGDTRRVAGEDFGDEEGVAASDGMQLPGRTVSLLGKRGHGGFARGGTGVTV